MSQLFLNYPYLSQEDSIKLLNLTNRSVNALTRSGIRTVGEVARLVESGRISTIQGLGRTSILEIKDRLAHVDINDAPEVKANTDAGIEIEQLNLTNPEKVPEQVIKWQSQLITKQLSAELLHEDAKIADRSVKNWLVKSETIETNKVYKILSTILGSSLNICEEIEFLLNNISEQRCLPILLSSSPSVLSLWVF